MGGCTAVQIGGVLQYLSDKLYKWGLLNVSHFSFSSSFRRVKSAPDPDTFQKYRDTPPTSIAILLHMYALLLAESSTYTTNLYHDTALICIAILLENYSGHGSLEHWLNSY